MSGLPLWFRLCVLFALIAPLAWIGRRSIAFEFGIGMAVAVLEVCAAPRELRTKAGMFAIGFGIMIGSVEMPLSPFGILFNFGVGALMGIVFPSRCDAVAKLVARLGFQITVQHYAK